MFQHHLSAIDNWLYEQLSSYRHQYALGLILTAGLFTDFLSEEIFEIIGPESMTDTNFPKPRRHDPLQLYHPKSEYAGFYGILSTFLSEPSRSLNYSVGVKRYATLATFLAIYLSEK